MNRTLAGIFPAHVYLYCDYAFMSRLEGLKIKDMGADETEEEESEKLEEEKEKEHENQQKGWGQVNVRLSFSF